MTVEELIKKYPKIYKDYEGNPGMVNWLDLPDGWIWLVDKMLDYLQFHIDHNKDPQFTCIQQKEKFGTLRFYIDAGNNRQNEVISFCESLSQHICQYCGNLEAKTENINHWLLTICNTCKDDLFKTA